MTLKSHSLEANEPSSEFGASGDLLFTLFFRVSEALEGGIPEEGVVVRRSCCVNRSYRTRPREADRARRGGHGPSFGVLVKALGGWANNHSAAAAGGRLALAASRSRSLPCIAA